MKRINKGRHLLLLHSLPEKTIVTMAGLLPYVVLLVNPAKIECSILEIFFMLLLCLPAWLKEKAPY